MAESMEEVSAAKRRRTFSEGEQPSLPKQQQHTKSIAEPVTTPSDVKTDDVPESTKVEGKHVADSVRVLGRKDRKRKRASIQSASEQESESLASTTAKAAKVDNNSSEIRCRDADTVNEDVRAAESKQDCKRSLQHSAENADLPVKKQKHVGKLKKEKKCKNKQKSELPRLRVISKLVMCMLCYIIVK